MDTATKSSAPVMERFAALEPHEFRQELDRVWQGVEKLRQSVIEQVEANRIDPVTGLGIVSCITGQAFGYQQFHGQPSQADVLNSLYAQASYGESRSR